MPINYDEIISMASLTPVKICAPKPQRSSLHASFPTRHNHFLQSEDSVRAPESDAGSTVSREIAQILQCPVRSNLLALSVVGNKTNLTQARRTTAREEKQPPRTAANPIVNDDVFLDIEKAGDTLPWEATVSSP